MGPNWAPYCSHVGAHTLRAIWTKTFCATPKHFMKHRNIVSLVWYYHGGGQPHGLPDVTQRRNIMPKQCFGNVSVISCLVLVKLALVPPHLAPRACASFGCS